jgi:hypothetical protein
VNEGLLLHEADIALREHELAKRSHDPVAIRLARARLRLARDGLARLKAEKAAQAAMSKALAAPTFFKVGLGGPPAVRKVMTEGKLQRVFDGRAIWFRFVSRSECKHHHSSETVSVCGSEGASLNVNF